MKYGPLAPSYGRVKANVKHVSSSRRPLYPTPSYSNLIRVKVSVGLSRLSTLEIVEGRASEADSRVNVNCLMTPKYLGKFR